MRRRVKMKKAPAAHHILTRTGKPGLRTSGHHSDLRSPLMHPCSQPEDHCGKRIGAVLRYKKSPAVSRWAVPVLLKAVRVEK